MGSNKIKKIGLYGGSFNPLHNQHLQNAQNALEQFLLDEVWFLPNRVHAFKGQASDIKDSDRVKMLELAIKHEPKFKAELLEMDSSEITYTFRTVEVLKERYPETEFYLIVGGDNISSFHKWKNAESLLKMVKIICCPRKLDSNVFDVSLSKYQTKINVINGSISDLSSSYLRSALKDGKSIRYYVPEPVYNYIEKHQLYR